MKTTTRYCIKWVSTAGDPTKQYYYFTMLNGHETLVMTRYMLAKHKEDIYGYELVKIFKGLYLYKQEVAIKMDTLAIILNTYNEKYSK